MQPDNQKKPISFIKVITTGPNPYKDRIIELAILFFVPDSNNPKSISRKYNPVIEISESVIKEHGFEGVDFSAFPQFHEKAKGLVDFLKDCDFAGYGIRNFDLPFLVEELNRAGESFPLYNRNIIDLESMYNSLNPRDFKSAIKQYVEGDVPLNNSMDELTASGHLFSEMCRIHHGQQFGGETISIENRKTLNKLFNPKANAIDCAGKIIKNVDGRPIFNMGTKHNGKLIADVVSEDPEYIQWLTTAAESLSIDTINTVKKIVAKIKK